LGKPNILYVKVTQTKDYGLEAKVKATGETEVILGTTSLCS
jgi:hypothetical protein